MIEFNGEFTSTHSREELWKYFTDPDILASCAPGCKSMEMVEPHLINAVISVGVGSVKPTFDVDVVITEADEPSTLKMQADGDAGRNAFETVAEMELIEDDDGTTATWTAQADVSGLIASLGQRGLGSVADRLVTNFFKDLEQLAEEGVPATSQMEAAPDAEATLD